MELWDSVVLQVRLWKTSLDLGAPDPAVRFQAIETLSQAGSAALPCLRFHLLRQTNPRVQFAAAIALHRLNVPEGMATLLRALEQPLTFSGEIAGLLEEAFLAIGSPAASSEMLACWPHLEEWQGDIFLPLDGSARIRMICRVWAGLQDPIVLDTLLAYSTRIPDLFPPTVAAFGQMAVRKLRDAAQSAHPFQRLLVVRTLERIPGEPSFQTLTPMLRDSDPAVRSEACCAIAQIGTPPASSEAVARAIQAGYSTAAAVQMLATARHPRLYEILLQLVERASYHTTHDTPAAVHAALDLLMQTPSPPERRLDIVCTLLEKPIPREITLTGINYIEFLVGRRPVYDVYEAPMQDARYIVPPETASARSEVRAREVLWHLLVDLAPEVRARAAQALVLCGDTNGKRFLELLAECRPQGSFIEKLTTLLRGGPDASQAATQAVQQVQQWVTRLSREAVVRLSSPTFSRDSSLSAIPQDPRVQALTRRLLTSALRYLDSAQAIEETEEALALSITAIRTLRRLGMPDALAAQPELLRAFHTCKQIETPGLQGLRLSVSREISEPVREEAALALIELLGPESFGLFVDALGAVAPEIQGTAILALGRLGDARAVPYLQPIAGNPDHLLAPHAIQSLAVIRQNNPEMMTLLRGSSLQDAEPTTLLRPLPYARPDAAPELLLRPSSSGEPLP